MYLLGKVKSQRVFKNFDILFFMMRGGIQVIGNIPNLQRTPFNGLVSFRLFILKRRKKNWKQVCELNQETVHFISKQRNKKAFYCVSEAENEEELPHKMR